MKKVSAHMKRSAWIVAIASVALLVGCSGTKRKLAADLAPINTMISLQQAWSISVGKSDPYTFRPVVLGDELLAASAGGNLYRVDASTGRVVWNIKVGSDLSAGPGTDGRLIAVANAKGMVYAFDMNGTKLWEESVGTEVLTEPLVGGGVVVVRTVDNRFVGLDAATGKRRWVYQRGQTALSLRSSYGMMNINNEVVMTGLSGGKFGLIALANGNLIWESLLSMPRGFSEIERLNDIAAKPSLVGSRMCAVSYQGKIGCGEIKTASIAWAKDFSSFTGVAQTPDRVFSANEKSHVVAFNAANGQEIWRNESMVWRDLGEPLAVGKVVVFGDGQGYVHLLSQDNGNVLGRVRVDSSAVAAAPVAAGGVIVVQSKGGTLAGFRPN